ncbi:MAG: hypothetical protein AB7S38_32710 [Vulcanimicrobiota bacterium]
MRIDQFTGEVRRISQRPHPLGQQIMGSSHAFTWRLDKFVGQDTHEARANLLQRAQQNTSHNKFWKNVTYGVVGVSLLATAGALGAHQAGLAAGVVYGALGLAGAAGVASIASLAAASVNGKVSQPQSDPTVQRMDAWLDFVANPEAPLFSHRPAPGQPRVRDFTRAEIVDFAQRTAAARQPCQEVVQNTTEQMLGQVERQSGGTLSEIEASFQRSIGKARHKAKLARAATWLTGGLAVGSLACLGLLGSHPLLAVAGPFLGAPIGVLGALTLSGKERHYDWQARNLDYNRELMESFVDYLNDPLLAAQRNQAYVHELAAGHEVIPVEETYDWLEVGSVGLARG